MIPFVMQLKISQIASVDIIKNFFNATFKTNPYLERAVLTGITRVSKESVFSDLNNLNVVTTSSTEYETSFGFTEEEVFQALEDLKMEELLQGKEIVVNFDEQIVFEQLDQDENAIWSLMLVSGYLKAEQIEYRGVLLEPWYHLRITNLETTAMFTTMFKGWFAKNQSNYNQFMKALLSDDIDAMNYCWKTLCRRH